MKKLLPGLVVVCGACASTPKAAPPAEDPPKEELVTRQAEPLVELPKRTAAARFTLSEEQLGSIEEALRAEADSTDLVVATGLEWEDGRRTAAVSHVRYPPLDMQESAFDDAVDESALDRCEEQFAGCYEGESTCSADAHEACVRSAYSDPFVYMSAHLGLDCGIYELSSYTLGSDGLRLGERMVLASMVCDFDPHYSAPAATDLDGDGGPELVYAYTHASSERPDELLVDSTVIIDANEMRSQFRHTMSAAQGELEGGVVTGLETSDEDGDGFPDLVVNEVRTEGYCPPIGYALNSDFVVRANEMAEEPPCDMTVRHRMVPYDPERDAWESAQPSTGESDE